MKLLVSDYDGTLTDTNGIVDKKAISAINRWIANGNLFVIATGRDPSILKSETDKYKIPFHYAICSNGSVITDKYYSNMYESFYSGSLAKKIITDPLLHSSKYFILSSNQGRHFIDGNLDFAKEKNFFQGIMSVDELDNQHCYGIDMWFGSHDNVQKIEKRIFTKYKEYVTVNPNIMTLDINGRNSSKSNGVYWLLQHKITQVTDVITVGDGGNDIDLISEFNGYSMDHSMKIVKEVSRQTVSSVAEVIDLNLDSNLVLGMKPQTLIYLICGFIIAYLFPKMLSLYIALYFLKQTYNAYNNQNIEPKYRRIMTEYISIMIMWLCVFIYSLIK